MYALDEVFGAALSGVIVNAWVLGLISVLSYQYYANFPRDGRGTKLLVAWMWALQTFNALVVSKMIYYYLISSSNDLKIVMRPIWEWSLYPGLSSIAAFSVQAYYAHRIFVLSKSYVLFGIILLFAFCQLGFGLATMSEALAMVLFTEFMPIIWLYLTWLSFSAACDLIIAATQVAYLHRHRTGITSTNHIINILIRNIMSTGLLTSIVAILELTTLATLRFNSVYFFLSFPMGAIYVVSFLANLDARRTVRRIGAEVSNDGTVPDHLSIEFRRVTHVRTETSDFQGDSTKSTCESNVKYKNDGQTQFA